jgi:hypothetical protein
LPWEYRFWFSIAFKSLYPLHGFVMGRPHYTKFLNGYLVRKKGGFMKLEICFVGSKCIIAVLGYKSGDVSK